MELGLTLEQQIPIKPIWSGEQSECLRISVSKVLSQCESLFVRREVFKQYEYMRSDTWTISVEI